MLVSGAHRTNGNIKKATSLTIDHNPTKNTTQPQNKTQKQPKLSPEQVFEKPEQYNIMSQPLTKKEFHIYALPKGEILKNDTRSIDMLINSAQQKRYDENSIVGLLCPDNIDQNTLRQKTRNTFLYIAQPDEKSGRNFVFMVKNINDLLRQYRENNPHERTHIEKVVVHGKDVDAFTLAQLLHIYRKKSTSHGGRPISYFNYQKDTIGAQMPRVKYVTFTRVDPQTGAYLFQGNQHVYREPFSEADETFSAKIYNTDKTIRIPEYMPIDVENNNEAFNKIITSKKEKFIRFVLSSQNIGAAHMFNNKKNELGDELEDNVDTSHE